MCIFLKFTLTKLIQYSKKLFTSNFFKFTLLTEVSPILENSCTLRNLVKIIIHIVYR